MFVIMSPEYARRAKNLVLNPDLDFSKKIEYDVVNGGFQPRIPGWRNGSAGSCKKCSSQKKFRDELLGITVKLLDKPGATPWEPFGRLIAGQKGAP